MKTKNILRFFLIMVVTRLFLSPPVFAGIPASECAVTIWQKFQGTMLTDMMGTYHIQYPSQQNC